MFGEGFQNAVTMEIAQKDLFLVEFEGLTFNIYDWQTVSFSVNNKEKKLVLRIVEPLFEGDLLIDKLSKIDGEFTVICSIFGKKNRLAYTKTYSGCKIEEYNEDDLSLHDDSMLTTMVVCKFDDVEYEKKWVN